MKLPASKKSIFIIIISFFFIQLISCLTEIKGSGDIVQQSIPIASFTSIDLAIDANVTLVLGEQQSVEILAQQNIIENIKTRVKSNKWVIEFEKNVRSHDPIDIIIVIPEIKGISISGSGEVYSDDYFETDLLDLSISGSGVIDLITNTNQTDASISGSGDIYISGTTSEQSISISGSGNYYGFNFESINCDVSISGSGNCEIFVTSNLVVSISGSGNVYYTGNPVVNSSITGSGQVIQSN